MNLAYKILISFAMLGAVVCPADEKRLSAKEQLIEKFTKRDGTQSNIVLFGSSTSSDPALGSEVITSFLSALRSYGPLQVRSEPHFLSAMSMEEMRTAMARFNVDILIGIIAKKTTVDAFLLDRRTPYNLYAHSEEVPSKLLSEAPDLVAAEVTRLLVRRLLARYLNEHYFELPREESLPVIQAELPTWVASSESLSLVNRELTSRFYLSASLGAAISMAPSNQLWNSNLIGLQLGIRLVDRLYLEGQATAFSYNAFVGSLRYILLNRNSPFQVNLGLGFGSVVRDKTWNLDQTIGLGRYSYYFVPSASLLFPVGRAYIKLEGQMFVAPGLNKFIWTFMPGIQVHF